MDMGCSKAPFIQWNECLMWLVRPRVIKILNHGLNNKKKAVVIFNSCSLCKRPMKCFIILLHNHNIRFDIMMFFFPLCCFIYLSTGVFCSQVQMGTYNDSRFWGETQHWHWNTVQTNCKIMKYSKMQVHGNVCVHQMCVIFILKIKDYFSSNKADETSYLYIFTYNILNNGNHKICTDWLLRK